MTPSALPHAGRDRADASPDEALRQHRGQFPALATKSYFNYGAHGPLPQPALEAIRQAFEYIQHWGPFSVEVNAWMQHELDQTRVSLATELGVAADTIALSDSISSGCNIVLWGMDWKPGDHLLLSDCENPGVIAAALELQRRAGIELSFCPLLDAGQEDPLAVVAAHVRPATRLIVLSHVLWNTGQVLPLADLTEMARTHPAARHRIRVLVDAAQSIGVLPVDLSRLGVDFCAFTAHKWWCGPEGVAGLYVSPDALESLRPTFIGWRGISESASERALVWQPDARRFEVGTSAYPLYAGWRASLAVHRRWGSQEERYLRIRRLNQHLWERLQTVAAASPALACIGEGPSGSGILALRLTGKSNQRLAYFLEGQGFMTRTMRIPDSLRICVHYFTCLSEIDQLVERIAGFCRART